MDHFVNKIHKITELEAFYDIFFFDIWGVIFEYDLHTTPKTVQLVNHLIEKKKIHFVSNASRLSRQIQELLKNHGFNVNSSDIVTTAGQTMYNLLNNSEKLFSISGIAPKNGDALKVYFLTEDQKTEECLDSKAILPTKDLAKADVLMINLHVQISKEVEQNTQNILLEARNFDIPAICINPDKHFTPNGENFYCPGYFAQQYSRMNGKVFYVGKPHSPIYEDAFNQSGFSPSKGHKILMIGDTLTTDVRGGIDAAIDTGLVLTGNTGKKSLSDVIQSDDIEAISGAKLDFQLQDIYPKYLVSLS